MTIQELLKSCSSGEMPNVLYTGDPIKAVKQNSGIVVVIKHETALSNFSGCGVKFIGLNYDIWFHAQPGTDKRSHYMTELEFANQ